MTAVARTADVRVTGPVRWWTMGMGVAALVLGMWGFFAPASFYDDFPVDGAEWVSTLGDFNEHLMRDYGAAQIGLGVTAVLAAASASAGGLRAILAGAAIYGVLHLGFHIGTFDRFSAGSALAQGTALATFVILPLILLVMERRARKGVA